MKILIEGEKYAISDLIKVFDDPKFYSQNGSQGIINYVGYYHSFEKNELIYLLPKVFVQEGKVFGKYDPSQLFEKEISDSFKHKDEYNWVRQLLIYFYNSLTEFKKRYSENIITEVSQTFELNSNLGINEYSYLDLVLSFVNYYKKNKNTILFHHIEFISNQAKKPKWAKTIRTSLPIINSNNAPIYTSIRNKKNAVNTEEELICYFYSILNYFNEEHHLNISIDKSYNIIKGNAFKKVQKTGLSKIRSIKYRYFSDTLKRMFQLCELYFSQTDTSSIKKRKEEFISVRNYNIVFEDMVDKLFSDKIDSNKKVDDTSLNDLKYNNDGKIIDHIYEYQSLIDTSNIFYIGDSKYYKSETEAGKLSTFKQFTYAKNVIQFNIDLFNNGNYYTPRIRYRDELTEGYNISPNFFIYGYISNLNDFDNPLLQPYKLPKKSFHFKERLFDRDTLFVHQYRINFLYVLKSYSSINIKVIDNFRKETKKKFRDNFIEYFNLATECGFELFEKNFEGTDLEKFVSDNFRNLNGKCISVNGNKLLIAKHSQDNEINSLITDFKRKDLQ
jgi:hypothetical protein